MLFAGVATGLNLLTQFIVKLSLRTHIDLNTLFLIQLITGTGVGFVFKFTVDKFFIFKERTLNRTLKQFIIYTLFAIITTGIFWGTESLFQIIFSFENRELLGGFLGLSIGYTTKFFLDKKWVFNVENSKNFVIINKKEK
uniref:GtrA family protein n=1 Tax=candidate division WOR-3 bacterium TaxID=2052148 RepID=A0A7C4Y5V5_UNCW3